jgi:hypothetical protein
MFLLKKIRAALALPPPELTCSRPAPDACSAQPV